ncbi:MAG: hypothetical protein LKG15_00400 [Corynebacterium provencense]|jgi:hypothetical protein|uniref:hypothetical protein n=1 Tax=Corynebacterium provencense TaxID=1737425 RepID=UPI002989AFAD|nr:hypothetical protein [Corynebacterium provencense]
MTKFVPPLPVPDRRVDLPGYERAIHINSLARASWEKRSSAATAPYGAATRPAPHIEVN